LNSGEVFILMSTAAPVEAHAPGGISPSPIVNDFSIHVATVNGSGSQTANNVLMRSIFRMGVPVSGKNVFPSNIQGLPTWFTIRASKEGWIGHKRQVEILVAMNPETAREDVMEMPPGGVVLYDEPLRLSELRSDLTYYSVPFDKILLGVCPDAKLRRLVRNIIYDGVLAHLLGIDLDEMRAALYKQFGPKKKKAADLNWGAIVAGAEWARNNLVKRDGYRIERMTATAGKILLDGNLAAGLGAIFAGCTVFTWYPITPSSSLMEQTIDLLHRLRKDEEGRNTFAVVQAEDELAAIGMVIGAGWAGARAMTATAGPGISLMAEFIGLGYYAEVPAVVVDVQRVGPSTGLPTRTQQCDTLKNAVLSHGDTKHPVLFPGSPMECFTMMSDAFDLAEFAQTPVFVNTDLDLGMNNWMSDPFPYPETPINRGKVLSAEDLERLGGFARYADVDGDGVGYRTIPGTNHPAAGYFTRGSGHNEKAQYSEKPADYKRNVDRLARKWETIRARGLKPEISSRGGNRVGIICYGTSRYAAEESRAQLRDRHGLDTDYCRIRSYPFSVEVDEFIDAHDRVYVIDQNRDAQMLALMKMDYPADRIARLRSVRNYDGVPIDAVTITTAILEGEGR